MNSLQLPGNFVTLEHISSGGWQCVTDSKVADEGATAEME